MLMEDGKQWLWGKRDPLLPTTRFRNRSVFPNFLDGVDYFRYWLQGTKPKQTAAVAKDNNLNGSPFRLKKKSTSSNSFVPVSFPAYLNSISLQQSRSVQTPRKSSLREGFQETLELISTSEKQTKLALPKDVQQKRGDRTRHFSQDSSHLPVPLVPLPKFRVPSTLYGYLDEASYRKGEIAFKFSLCLVLHFWFIKCEKRI